MPYSSIQFNIKQSDDFYEYCNDITHAASNLRNAALFRLRQDNTLVNKSLDKLTQNELDVYNIGDAPVNRKEADVASIIPYHNIYILSLVFIDATEVEMVSEKPKRICDIDLGVDNFAAITNNIGKECLLFKGEVIKSKNQWYNKQISKLKSEQTAGTPGKSQKFIPTPESNKLCINRDFWMKDFMHKCAKRIIDWCVENSIDTIIVGENKEWKQNIDTGKKNNQTFVSIPFNTFKFMLEYLCERNGIRFIRQEESYTSKASFIDNDEIPVYKANNTTKYTFSGKRAPTTFSNEYGEHSNKNGYRGLYRTKDDTIINSDLNGSANIGRKAILDMFTMEGAILPDLNNVKVYKHPDEYFERKIERSRKRFNQKKA
ncbi:MAG: RNA-guided endonuclease TnpB family protein [Erysipelotrichaceae bacterium]|nr:RNA-guided endonuclease TnpB family protein [Erysipelotrichaceae bacterium]